MHKAKTFYWDSKTAIIKVSDYDRLLSLTTFISSGEVHESMGCRNPFSYHEDINSNKTSVRVLIEGLKEVWFKS